MNLKDIAQHLKSMGVSMVMMLLLTVGMATKNPWLQPTYIILIIFAVQMGYMMIRSARSSNIVEANLKDASRAMRGPILFKASEKDINKAKESSTGSKELGMGSKMLVMMLTPLIIFIGVGYLLERYVPGIEQWQSYVIRFLLSMLVSTLLTFRMGISRTRTSITPKSYAICSMGVAYTHLGQSFLVRFPLINLKVEREKNFIEAEGKSEAPTIPNKVKMFTVKVDQLHKILVKHTTDQRLQKA